MVDVNILEEKVPPMDSENISKNALLIEAENSSIKTVSNIVTKSPLTKQTTETLNEETSESIKERLRPNENALRPFYFGKGKSYSRKFRRNERCKYCRRLLSHSPSVWVAKESKWGSSNFQGTSLRRTLDSPMDEVAWACGRLWCSVRRRKRRKLHFGHQRKQINQAFSTLREILPPAAGIEEGDSAAAKVSTLRLAASYIQALSDLLKDIHLSETEPKVINDKLHLQDEFIKDRPKIYDLSSEEGHSLNQIPKQSIKLESPTVALRNCGTTDSLSSSTLIMKVDCSNSTDASLIRDNRTLVSMAGKDSPLECV